MNVESLLVNGNLRDVYLGLVDIGRTGWINRGVPLPFLEDDFAHTAVVEKGAVCAAARFGYDLELASLQGFVHEFAEYVYGDKVPGEVDDEDKRISETNIMRDVCGRSGELNGLFALWEDFDKQYGDLGRSTFYVDKVSNTPVSVAYRNNMDSIVEYYSKNPVEFAELKELELYEGVKDGDVFDVMLKSLDEFHDYAKRKVGYAPVFVDSVDAVVDMKSKDVDEIFDVFYRSLAGKGWGKVKGRDFLKDRLSRDKVGLRKLRVSRDEVLGLISGL